MPGVVEFIKHHHEEEQLKLQETPEEAHTHTLWVMRMESQQRFLEERVPDNHERSQMIGMLQRMRELIGPALKHKVEAEKDN